MRRSSLCVFGNCDHLTKLNHPLRGRIEVGLDDDCDDYQGAKLIAGVATKWGYTVTCYKKFYTAYKWRYGPYAHFVPEHGKKQLKKSINRFHDVSDHSVIGDV